MEEGKDDKDDKVDAMEEMSEEERAVFEASVHLVKLVLAKVKKRKFVMR